MKKALMSLTTLLVLFVIVPVVITPVMAAPATKTPFTSEVSFVFGNIDEGRVWTTEDGILHIKGAVSEGTTCMHVVGIGDIQGTIMVVHDLTIDLNTGEGGCHGKFVVTVVGVGTFEGSEHGIHTIIGDYHGISGKVVAQGNGMFEGLKMMGSYEGEIVTVDTQQVVEMAMEGTLLSPTG